MQKPLNSFALAATTAFGVLTQFVAAAPALADKPVRWEYAELKFSTKFKAPPGGGDFIKVLSVVWTTADEEIEGRDWDDLANKLKAPASKKEGSSAQQKLRLMNRLGADGWEIVGYKNSEEAFKGPGQLGGFEIWTFKRRVP